MPIQRGSFSCVIFMNGILLSAQRKNSFFPGRFEAHPVHCHFRQILARTYSFRLKSSESPINVIPLARPYSRRLTQLSHCRPSFLPLPSCTVPSSWRFSLQNFWNFQARDFDNLPESSSIEPLASARAVTSEAVLQLLPGIQAAALEQAQQPKLKGRFKKGSYDSMGKGWLSKDSGLVMSKVTSRCHLSYDRGFSLEVLIRFGTRGSVDIIEGTRG